MDELNQNPIQETATEKPKKKFAWLWWLIIAIIIIVAIVLFAL